MAVRWAQGRGLESFIILLSMDKQLQLQPYITKWNVKSSTQWYEGNRHWRIQLSAVTNCTSLSANRMEESWFGGRQKNGTCLTPYVWSLVEGGSWCGVVFQKLLITAPNYVGTVRGQPLAVPTEHKSKVHKVMDWLLSSTSIWDELEQRLGTNVPM